MSAPIQVSLIEDDAGVRRELEALLNAAPGFQCRETYRDAEAALAELPRCPPDLVLVDVHLPGLSGLECVRRLKELCPALPVVMLTVHDERSMLLGSLAAGASASLVKSSPRAKFLEALHEIAAGGVPLTRSMARWISECFPSAPSPSESDTLPTASPTLTSGEAEQLARLAQGYSAPEIAAALGLSDDALHAHSVRICKKLRVLLGASFPRQSPAA